MSEGGIQPEAVKRDPRFEGDRWELPTDISIIDPAQDEVIRRMDALGWDDDAEFDIRFALSETLSNAIIHGNLGGLQRQAGESLFDFRDRIREAQGTPEARAKRVRLQVHITPQEVRIIITDEGPGFQRSDVTPVVGSDGKPFLKDSGRGLDMLRSYLDEVRHNEKGNEVTIVKRRTMPQ